MIQSQPIPVPTMAGAPARRHCMPHGSMIDSATDGTIGFCAFYPWLCAKFRDIPWRIWSSTRRGGLQLSSHLETRRSHTTRHADPRSKLSAFRAPKSGHFKLGLTAPRGLPRGLPQGLPQGFAARVRRKGSARIAPVGRCCFLAGSRYIPAARWPLAGRTDWV